MEYKYNIKEIIDFNQLETLLVNFNKLCNFPTVIFDSNDEPILRIGWLDTCKYLNSDENNCIDECKKISKSLRESYVGNTEGISYKCLGGFDNIAYPIIIEEQYYGCFITGQFQIINEKVNLNLISENNTHQASTQNIKDYLQFVKNLIDMMSEIGIKELKRKESELIYHTVIENSNDGFWNVGKNAEITKVNDRYSELSGYSKEEILKMHIFEFDVQQPKREFGERSNEIQRVGSKVFESKHKKKNGEIFDVEVNTFPSIVPNELYAFIRDISDRKKIERDLEKQQIMLSIVLNSIPESVFWKDLQGNFLGCNAAFAKSAGMFISAQIIGKNDYQMPWNQFADLYRADDFNVMKTREAKYNIVEELITADGKKQWINTTKVPLINEMDEVFGVLGIFSDITEKKLAEEKIIESEKKLKEAQKLSQIGHWELNIETMELIWSDEIFNIFEIDKSEFGASYSAFLNAIHPEDRDMVNEAYTKSIKNKLPYEITHRLLMPSGEIKYVNERCRTEYDDDNPTRSLGTVQDITDLVLSEERLKKVEVQLITALEMAKLGHWEYDFINDKFLFNDQFYKLYKMSFAEIGSFELNFEQYLKYFVHPDDVLLVKNTKETIQEDNNNFSNSVKLQHRFLSPNGDVGYISVLYYVVKDLNGKISKIYGINQDITEIVKSEEALRKNEFLLRESQKLSSIGHYDLNFATQKWESSDALNSIFGINKYYATDIEGWIQLIHPEDKQMMNNYLVSLINNKQLNFDKIYRIIRQNDNEIRWVHGLGLISYTDSGIPNRMFGNIQDITERIIYEKELVDAKNKAEQSEKLKVSFLQNMSHEIRTPLNGIMGFTSLLKDFDDLEVDERKEYIDMILGSSSRLLNIVNDVLELSSIESGISKLNFSTFKVSDIISNIKPIYEKTSAIKNLTFNINSCHQCEDIYIKSDKGKLIQILVNLLNNAFKFTNSGSVTLDFVIKDNQLYIKVSDTGIGIPNEYITKIFDRFWQYEAFTNQKFGGTGLGLSISQKLSHLLGTNIEVESTVNQGSTFTLLLKENLLITDAENIIQVVSPTKSTSLENLSILIAEDEETNYYYLISILKKLGIKSDWAQNGEKAVEMAKNKKYDIILMDLKMPVMDGFEAIKVIREFESDLPIIAQTAYSDENDQQKALNSGFNSFISKPYEPDALINLLTGYSV